MSALWGYPRRHMITHTIDSYWIPSQKKTNSKLQILKNCQQLKFWYFCKKTLHTTHVLNFLEKEVQIWNGSGEYCGRYRAATVLSTDGRAGGQTDKVKPVYSLSTSLKRGDDKSLLNPYTLFHNELLYQSRWQRAHSCVLIYIFQL